MLLSIYQLWEGRMHNFTWISASGGEQWSWDRLGSTKEMFCTPSSGQGVLGSWGQQSQRICIDQKPHVAQAEIISCFCGTICLIASLLSLHSIRWHNPLYWAQDTSFPFLCCVLNSLGNRVLHMCCTKTRCPVSRVQMIISEYPASLNHDSGEKLNIWRYICNNQGQK